MSYIYFEALANCEKLEEVYCYAKTVPATSSDAFNNSYINYATLYVPEKSVDAYKAKAPLEKLWNIQDA